MNAKVEFAYYFETGDKDVGMPSFHVVWSTIAGLPSRSHIGLSELEAANFPVPKYPSYKTWLRETAAKRRCFRCWATTKTHADWVHHRLAQHGERVK
jgi:hypothetical protein